MTTLFPKTYTYSRVTGARTNGVWVPTLTPATFVGSIQPTTGKDTDFLPIGRRDTGSVKIYSNTELKTSAEGSSDSGDIVTWQGRKWEVVTSIPAQNGLIPHYKYLAVNVGAA